MFVVDSVPLRGCACALPLLKTVLRRFPRRRHLHSARFIALLLRVREATIVKPLPVYNEDDARLSFHLAFQPAVAQCFQCEYLSL